MKSVVNTLFFAALLILAGYSFEPTVTLNTHAISVEIADEPTEWVQGLMNREALCVDCGMLFIFDKENTYGFWMKHMNFPIDIIFINKDYVITSIHEAEPCEYEPCDTYAPTQLSLYVLEVNQGTMQAYGVKEGDRVRFRNVE